MFKDIQNLLKHASIYGIGTILSKAVGFMMIPLYTHHLSPSDYGVLELLDLTTTVAGIFIAMGIGAAIFRFYYYYENEQDKLQVISTSLVFVATVITLFLLIVLPLSGSISVLVFNSTEYKRYFMYMFISLSLSIIASVPEAFIMARQRSVLFTAISIGTLVVNLAMNIIVVAVLKWGVLGIVMVSAIARFLNTSFLIGITHKQLFYRPSYNKLKQMLAYGLPLIPARIGQFVIDFSDRYFINHYSTLTSVGIYSLGYKFGFMISFLLVQPFERIWQAKVFEISSKKDSPVLFGRIFTYFCFVMVYAVLSLSVMIPYVVTLIAPKSYWNASKLIPLIAFSYAVRGTGVFFQSGLLIKRKTNQIGFIMSMTAVVNVLANFILIRHYDLWGAAIASVLSSLMLSTLLFKMSEMTIGIVYEWKRILILFLSGLLLLILGYQIDFSSYIFTIIAKVLYLLSFPYLLYLLGFYHKDEELKLRELFLNRI